MGMLLGYDEDGNIVAALDMVVKLDENRKPIGYVDFAEHEAAGRENTELWRVRQKFTPRPGGLAPAYDRPARGSKYWPEDLTAAEVEEYKVELAGEPGNKRISALVHKVTGARRERPGSEDAK